MADFQAIRDRAAGHHGGEDALAGLLTEIPDQASLKNVRDDRWLAQMTKCVFQAGFNWKVIESKWAGFELAFEGFDPGRWSLMSDDDLDRLLKDTRVVRHAKKLLSVGGNARFVRELACEHGSAGAFFAGWPASDQIGLLEVMKTRGERLGGATAQYFLRFSGKDSFITSRDVCVALINAGVVDKAPTSKRDLAAVQTAFNRWHDETDLAYTHLSRILALSVG